MDNTNPAPVDQISIHIKGLHLHLHSTKVMRLPDHNMMIIGDLHIGKIEHFRNNGIALPPNAAHTTTSALQNILTKFPQDTVIFLGDLFHSVKNESVALLQFIRQEYKNQKWILVRGNHDILANEVYTSCDIEVVASLQIGDLLFTHEPQTEIDHTLYNISAHLHPAIRINGKGKQSLVLPCFYFGEASAIIPAFGYFTGKALIRPKKDSKVFATTHNSIIEM